MFRALREKLLGASKQAEEELDPKLNLDYETFRPEERESGAVIRESHLENVLWEMELALLQSDVAMEALEDMKAIIKKRLVGLRVENRSEIVPTIEKALKASLVELLSKNVFNLERAFLYPALVGIARSSIFKSVDVCMGTVFFKCTLHLNVGLSNLGLYM